MNIHFKNIMPEPLKGLKHNSNSIWGADFELTKGSKVMLNATSGKGKTTFTHILSGIRKDYEGELLFDKQELKQLTPNAWAKLRQQHVSVVYQDLQLFYDLSVAENLQLKNQLTQTFDEDHLKALTETLGIADKWNTPCRLLSMGQQQRVAIIRALAQPFDWLIMDEPFSHLDAENTERCLSLINERCNELDAGFVLTSLGDPHGFNYDLTLNL